MAATAADRTRAMNQPQRRQTIVLINVRRARTEMIARIVTAPRTTAPPTSAQRVGFSCMKSSTQIGLSTGSIAGIKTASRAVTCLMARAYSQ